MINQDIQLKPLSKVFEHGVLVYGFEVEKQMWEFKGVGGDWQDLPDHANYDDVIKGMSSRFYEHRRKTSAARIDSGNG